MFSLEMFITRTCIFISIIVYIALGNNITADTAYSVTAVYSILRPIVTMLFSIGIASFAEIYVSVCRLQTFLSYKELPSLELDSNMNKKLKENITYTINDPKLVLKNVSAKWLDDSTENTLTDININIDKSQLVAIIGPVGSGKTSLLNVILKELPISGGLIDILGEISYASQDSWIFSSSVKQNILFGAEYDKHRYNTVVKVCALEPDLELLPYGDRTIVGEKGKSLSGGQKARINLARAVYKAADIYLLDDPLSAVDTKVGKQLYEQCVRKFLNDKICILITHQLQYLKNADKIIIIKDGKIIGEGSYDDLQKSGLDFAKLLHEFSAGEENENTDTKKITSRQNSVLSTKSEEDDLENPDVEKEELLDGNIKLKTYSSYFGAGGNYLMMIMLALAFVASQAAGNAGDYFVSYWYYSKI